MGRPFSSAASFIQFDRQLRQKPARFIMSMFCTSVRDRRCSTSRRYTAASSSVRVLSSIAASSTVGKIDTTRAGLKGQRPDVIGERRVKFAHFSHVWGKPGMTPHQRYEELWRELRLCDELDYDYGFCVEHHFRPDESWISSPSVYIVGAAARTRKIRVGSMGYIVPLYHPLRLAEEIALVDQMIGGRMELGLVPGINAEYFKPFGFDYNLRKSPTLEFVEYLRAAYGETQPFSFHGEVHNTDSALLAVQPVQKPHPPLWMMSRDPQTLEFCARHGINPGYFLVYPRADAAPRYRKFLADWAAAGHRQPPKIAY